MKQSFRSLYLGIGTAIIGIAMVAVGVLRGEDAVVLTKAIKICLECIGIG